MMAVAVSGAGLLLARPLLGAAEVKPTAASQATPQATPQVLPEAKRVFELGKAPGVNMPRFVVLPGAGGPVVRDTETGRMWERAPGSTAYSFTAAKAMCDAKVLGGHSDWRLPRIEELKALLAGPVEAPLPAGHPFTVSGSRWSSTELSATAANYILVTNGNTFIGTRATAYPAWCVRGGGNTAYPNSNPRFTVDGLQVVDTQTGRVWKRASTSLGTWHKVRGECLGHGPGWRLPTMAEMTGLLDMSAPETPKLPAGHPFNNAGTPYDERRNWSLDASSVSAAATLRFRDGAIAAIARSVEGVSRCIKMDLAAAWPLGPVGRFAALPGGGAALDQETRLLWELAPTMTGVQYPTALAACAGRSIGGLSGWRLATLEELTTLIDRDVSGGPKLPAGHPFVGVSGGDYWTTTQQQNGSDMMTVDLGSGLGGHMSKMGGHLIGWCVRPEP